MKYDSEAGMERVKLSSSRLDQDILRGSFYREKDSLRGSYHRDERGLNVTEQDSLRAPYIQSKDTVGSYISDQDTLSPYIKEQDTLKVSKCGCVPQISLVYEDVGKGIQGIPRWTRRIPLFGPLWCVSGATGTKIRRR